MNYLFLLLIIFSTFSNTKKGVPNFEYQLIEITRNFKEKIMDKDECEKLKREADDLGDEIELAMEMEEEYTPAEMAELKKLKIEAEAMEEYIGSVGNCGNYVPTIANFNLANKRVRNSCACF